MGRWHLELSLIWVYRSVGPDEREAARAAHEAGKLLTNWNCPYNFRTKLCTKPFLNKPPKDWARSVGWPTPLFSFEERFLKTMLSNDDPFRLAMDQGGVELFVPVEQYQVPEEDVEAWDGEIKDPKNWDALASGFRELCRIINFGVPVVVQGRTYTNSGIFYNEWIYQRYKVLEEGSDIFILEP